jgi:uncharacterized membrane protein YfcA
VSPVLVAALILGASALYATAGQAGGTAFLAVMALADIPTVDMRPTSLVLNLAAAGCATARLHWAGAVAWPLLRRLLAAALPAAFLGGLIVLEGRLYLVLTGSLLLAAAALMLLKRPGNGAEARDARAAASIGVGPVLLAGSATGFVSGLTGVGGGVFLAPSSSRSAGLRRARRRASRRPTSSPTRPRASRASSSPAGTRSRPERPSTRLPPSPAPSSAQRSAYVG